MEVFLTPPGGSRPEPFSSRTSPQPPGDLLEKYPWAREIKRRLDMQTSSGSDGARAARGSGSGSIVPPSASWKSDGVPAAGHSLSAPTHVPEQTSSELSSLESLVKDPAATYSWGLALMVAKYGTPAARRAFKARGWLEMLAREGTRPMDVVLLPRRRSGF